MGGYRWAQCAALILLVLSGFEASAATRKYVTLPSAKSVATGNGATSRNGDLLSKQGAALEGEYIPGESLNKSVPVPIIPRIDFSIPTTINAAKGLLKGGVQGMLINAALQEMLDSVGALIDEGGQVVKHSDGIAQPVAETDYRWGYSFMYGSVTSSWSGVSPDVGCTRFFNDLSNAFGSATERTSAVNPNNPAQWSCQAYSAGWKQVTISRTGSTCPSGSEYDPAHGYCVGNVGDVKLPDSDWDAMGQFANGQSADWLAGLLKDVCSAGSNPDSCFEAMKAGSALSGPASVPGGSTTTTGTYTRPDGTTGTQTATTTTHYKITYGDNYFDFSKSVNTTTAQDGKTTSESQTDENPDPTQEEKPEDSFTDPAMPDVPSFYEPQYPDGLQGVWQAKQTALDDSAFLQFLRSFVPSFSGTCPSWGLSFDLGFISFGNHGFGSQCYALDFVGIVFLVTAAFAARALIFGG